jgi:AcrR family transcriptional regulator
VTTPATRTARIRLTPDQRRAQLLELGVELLADRAIDDLSIDLLAEQAGVSRGLVHHYFGNLVGYREAVVRHAVEQLVAATAPPAEGEPIERLVASVGVYVDYVVDNVEGYRSIVRAAAGGTDTMRELYESARSALTDRIFREDAQGTIIPDTPAARLVVRGWSAWAEEVTLSWVEDLSGLTRDRLVEVVSLALPSLVGVLETTTLDPGGSAGGE